MYGQKTLTDTHTHPDPDPPTHTQKKKTHAKYRKIKITLRYLSENGDLERQTPSQTMADERPDDDGGVHVHHSIRFGVQIYVYMMISGYSEVSS